jgi:hypothetical protein
MHHLHNFTFPIALMLLTSSTLHAENEADHFRLANPWSDTKKTNKLRSPPPAIQNENLASEDCDDGISEYDSLVLGEIDSAMNSVRDLKSNPEALRKRIDEIVDLHYDKLSPMARALVYRRVSSSKIQNLFVDSQSPEEKKYLKYLKYAQSRFESYFDSYIESTPASGKSVTETSKGVIREGLKNLTGNSLFDNNDYDTLVLKNFQESWLDLNKLIIEGADKNYLSEEQKQQLLDVMGEQARALEAVRQKHGDASIQRIEALRNSMIQLQGVYYTTITAVAATYAKQDWLAKALASHASTTLFGQAKFIADAMIEGGDVGCQFAIQATAGNDQLGKDALKVALVGTVEGAVLKGLFSVAPGVVDAYKMAKGTNETLGNADSFHENASDHIEEVGSAAAYEEEAKIYYQMYLGAKESDPSAASRYLARYKEATNKSKDAKINARKSAVNAGLDAVGFVEGANELGESQRKSNR